MARPPAHDGDTDIYDGASGGGVGFRAGATPYAYAKH